MVAVEWKEPPAHAVMTGRDQLVALLKRNPGRWARVKRDLKSKTGTATWKKLGLDAVAAPAESDATKWDIYARAPEPTQKVMIGGEVFPAKTSAPTKKAQLIAQKVSKPRPATTPPATSAAPSAEAGDLAAQARVKEQMARRMGHRRG